MGLAFEGSGDFFKVYGKRESRGGWQVLKGSILSYTISCVQNLAVAEKPDRHCEEENGWIPSVREAENKPINFSMEKRKKTFLNFFFEN